MTSLERTRAQERKSRLTRDDVVVAVDVEAVVEDEEFSAEVTVWKLLDVFVNSTLQLQHFFAGALHNQHQKINT